MEIHRALLECFGGLSGVRDPGLLESALFRPRTGYYQDLAGMAAALFESLKVEVKKARRFLIGLLEEECCTFDELLPWIREHATRM